MKGVSALAVGLAAAGALLLSGCVSSTMAVDPTVPAVAAVPAVSAPAAQTPAASAPAAPSPSEDSADQVVVAWTCENDGTNMTCICEGEKSSCRETVSKPSKVKGATGTVNWFNAEKGYGFITPAEGGMKLFAHYSEIRSSGYKTLEEGQTVSFEIGQGAKGPSATNIQVL
jgi:CspA family cold shock protein